MTKISFLTSAILTFVVGVAPTFTSPVHAQVNGDFSAVPPQSRVAEAPLVMLSMSRDHQYFLKAYNDYTDLDPETGDVDANGNPNIETTYKHSFDYFGYFDPFKCYSYSNANDLYTPVSVTQDKYCNGNRWSGNFLNWVTMTRMDVIRSIFYGGKRVVDTDSQTVLERAHLTMDAHSFAKYYNGPDIADLTPFSPKSDANNGGDSDGFDDIDEGITFCNTTFNTNSGASQNSTQPPLIRVVEGNYQFWGSNERWQCTLSGERRNATNGNIPPSAPRMFVIDGVDVTIDSGIDAHSSDPSSSDDYVVRVEVCKAGLIGSERCKQYPTGEPKPIGILQTYGDTDLIRFGLMTGSYENNIQGGVLRKNIGDFSDEINVDTDGTFKFSDTEESIIRTLDVLRLWGYRYSDGQYEGGGAEFDDCRFNLTTLPNGRCRSWGNPISEIYRETLNYLGGRTADPSFTGDDSVFIDNLRSHDWEDPLNVDNQCADLSTILINASVSSYDNDEISIDGLAGGINTSLVNSAPIIANAGTTDEWTNRVGVQEGFNQVGRTFFIGDNGTVDDELCTAKAIGNLSDVNGLCPEAPSVNGSFAMAGLAYYAHNNDIRADLEGNQTVNTFAIALATNVPVIQIPRTNSSEALELLPSYRNLREDLSGGLVDFKIVKPHTDIGGGRFEASFYVNWEVAEQGSDYDQDLWGTINYILDENRNELTVTTNAVFEASGARQLMGFITSGTTQDGFHAFSGSEGADFDDPTGVPGCDKCETLLDQNGVIGGNRIVNAQQGPQSHTFTLQAGNVSSLESPLFYAAKYGGFEENRDETIDVNGNPVIEELSLTDAPDELNEWDEVDNTTGADGADGLPDNFFFVINPENLFNSIENTLNQILAEERSASSSVASFANSNGFGNIVVQGTYQELLREATTGADGSIDEVEWTGELVSFFIDDFGLFRQDNGIPGLLENYVTDRAFRYDVSGNDGPGPRIQLLNVAVDVNGNPVIDPATGGPTITNFGNSLPLEDLDALWNAGDLLRSVNNVLTKTQRTYGSTFPVAGQNQASRHILSYIDSNLNGVVDAGEQIDFTEGNINANNFGFFGSVSETQAKDIVNYIRGFEDPTVTGLRNRTVDLDADGNDEIYRLGDLINSTPLVVAGPNSGYDTRFGDLGYQRFREQYEDRRQVAYVGANDGLLHAFNVGFRDANATDVRYELSGDNSETSHPLGAELWAYAPFNLLPHLQFLTSNFYTHVFYVDGSPKSFDVRLPNIFTNDVTHPDGWGTILVVGMRLGGGDFPVTNGADSTILRSAYVVLDITDPESPPRVLAEINHPDLNLTTSEPDIFYECGSNCTDNNDQNNFNGDWQLVFGSGPNDIRSFTSTETAKIFSYNLNARSLVVTEVEDNGGNSVDSSFVGNVAVRDWDNGILGFRNDDIAYFGTVGSIADVSTADPNDRIETGAVYRYQPDFPAGDRVTQLIDLQRPVVQAPLLTNGNSFGNNVLSSRVFVATGIYLSGENEFIAEQERIYGITEPVNVSTINGLNTATFDPNRENSTLLTRDTVRISDIIDVTDVDVLNNDDGQLPATISTGDLRTPLVVPGGNGNPGGTAENVDQLEQLIFTNSQGWFVDLPLGVTAGVDPSARVVDRIVPVRDQILLTAFSPTTENRVDICVGGEGVSRLFVLNQGNGVPSSFATLGVDNTGTVNSSTILGPGVSSSPIVFTSEALGANDGVIITQQEDGSLSPSLGDDPLDNAPIGNSQTIRSGWREIFQ